MHSEFKGQRKQCQSWALERGGTSLAQERRGLGRAMAERQMCVFPLLLPLHFPPCFFPKVENYQKGFENENCD